MSPAESGAWARRTPVWFVVALAGGSLVALVVLVLVVRGAAVPALAGLVLAVLPIPLILAGLLYLDRLEPEPRGLLAAVFAAGALAGGVSGLVGEALGSGLISLPELGAQAGQLISTTLGAALLGAVVAEALKGLVLVGLARLRGPELDGTHDGVVYGSLAGLGFALVANLFAYVRAEHAGVGALASAFARRGLLAPLWDPLFTSMIGVGLAYAAMRGGRRGWWAIGAGWAAAVALHALWADSVTASAGQLAVVYLILMAVLAGLLTAVIVDRRRIVGLITTYLPAYESDGVLDGQDVQMLASLYWRRVARQWARLYRGLAGARTMSDYQLAATELALACRRQDRGLMSADAFAARRDSSLALMRAAVSALRDPEPSHQPSWAVRGPSAFALPDVPPADPDAQHGHRTRP